MDNMLKWVLGGGGNAHHHHPYHPPSARIANYEPNETPIRVTGAAFVALIVAFVGVGSYGLCTSRPRTAKVTGLSVGDQFGICWFLLCEFPFFFVGGGGREVNKTSGVWSR